MVGTAAGHPFVCWVFLSGFVLCPRSGLGEQRAGVGGVRGGVAPDLQRFPQLHLLLLDKPELSQEVPAGAAEAGARPVPRPGQLARLVQRFHRAL